MIKEGSMMGGIPAQQSKDAPKTEKFQQWYPITDLYRNAPDKKQFMDAMRKGGINIKGENITPIDFFATSPDLSDDEIVEAIEGYLDVENLENKIEALNAALVKAKDYIENYLHKDLPKEIKNLKDIKSAADVIKIFKRTAVAKEGEGVGLSPAYCALISVAVASFEFGKKEMDGLTKESEFLYEAMFKTDENTGVQNFHCPQKERTGYDKVIIYDDVDQSTVIGNAYFRGKNEDSLISKFINKPEATAEEAAKDGIGFKFEVRTIDDIKKVVPVVARYFKKNFGAKDFVFGNTKLLSQADIDEVREKSEKQLGALGEGSLTAVNYKNEYSNKNFKKFGINGNLYVPVRGDVDGMRIKRQFEVQIVLVDNDNATGFSNHSVYEMAKKLSVVTRLFGSFTEKYLDIVCNEASAESGISVEKIKRYMKDSFLVEIEASGYSKKRYASKKNAGRFLKSGIFPDKQIRTKDINP
ncbi:MAG: hypothetical protein WC120_03905 [Parcubacteria group bacterium]